ncbi:Protein GVQW1 [Plecturocebus cupreus]
MPKGLRLIRRSDSEEERKAFSHQVGMVVSGFQEGRPQCANAYQISIYLSYDKHDRRRFTLVAKARVQWHDLSSPQLPPPGFNSWDYRRAPPQPANFVFLVEMGFLHVGQAGLKRLTSGDLPSWASQTAGITALWEGEKGELLELRSSRQPGQNSETTSLQKIQKLAKCGGMCL